MAMLSGKLAIKIVSLDTVTSSVAGVPSANNDDSIGGSGILALSNKKISEWH